MPRRAPAVGLLLVLLTVVAPPAVAEQSDPNQRRSGERRAPVTPAGWRVDPAGDEIAVSKLATGFQGPLGSDLSPDGKRLISASSGAARIESVDLFDLDAGERTDSVPYDALEAPGEAAFYGIAYSPDGKRAWASGGGQNVVHAYDVTGDGLKETATIATPFFPAGMAYGETPLGDRLYVANNLSAPAAAGLNPPGNRVTVIDPATNAVLKTIDLGVSLQPFGVAFRRDGKKAYVTNWMGRSVSVIDTATETKVKDVQLSPQTAPLEADHPSATSTPSATRSTRPTPTATRSR